MNFAQVKDKAVDVLKAVGIITPDCGACPCKTESDAAFRAGAKAMFDSLMFRAANHYHGIPELNKQCQAENALVTDWAEDALMEVDPESHFEWKSLDAMYMSGYAAGMKESNKAICKAVDQAYPYTDGTFMGSGGV